MPYEIAQKLFGPEMNEGLKFLLFHAVVILPTAYTDLGKNRIATEYIQSINVMNFNLYVTFCAVLWFNNNT